MKNLLRVLCVTLAVLMLVGLIACAKSENGDTDSAVTTAQNGPVASETVDEAYVDDLPTLDFKGTKINMVALDKAGVADEFYSEGLNKESINDAVHERNVAVQEKLNVELSVKLEKEPHTVLNNAVKGGDDSVCDIVAHSTMYGIQSVQKASYLNIHDTEYVNTEKRYWSQGFNDLASFGTDNKQYLLTGEMAMSLFRYMFVTIYNKEEFENKNLDDLFDVVENGDWTLEYQQKIIQDTYVDRDGDSKLSEGDFYGLISGDTVSIDPYCVAAGIELVGKNEDGEWEFMPTEDNLSRMDELCDWVRRIYNESNGTYVFKGSLKDDTGLTYIAQMFTNKQALMATVQLYALETTAVNAEFLYGIVPMPKLSATQKEYASYVQDQVTSVGISATVTGDEKKDAVSAFLECMASISNSTIVQTYYHKALSYKYLQEANSLIMLNKIYDSVKFDFCGAFGNVLAYNVRDNIRPIFSGTGGKALSSTIAKQEKSMNKSLKKFNDNMNNMQY